MNPIRAGPAAFTCHYCKKEVQTIYVCWDCEIRMCEKDLYTVQICLKPHINQGHIDHDTCHTVKQN